MPKTAPFVLHELAAHLGREESLHTVHGAVLRAAGRVQPIVEAGTILAACSDEFNGELRSAFDRDVARMLSAQDIPSTRRVFAVSNMGGRIEPGAIALANLHFTARSARAGEKLLLMEISSHVGRREAPEGTRWGELERFGPISPCCGALRLLLDVPQGAAVVRYPWFDQLNAFFGPQRLEALRARKDAFQMLRTAIVHAVLQAETAIVDLLREPPTTGTHVLIVTLVVVNRRGPDNAIPVGLHHLHFVNGEAESVQGVALRSTPDAIAVDDSQAMLRVSSPFEGAPLVAPPAHAPEHVRAAVPHGARSRARERDVRAHVERHRRQLTRLRHQPHALHVYARATLRAFLQGLSLVAPEVGLAVLALESGRDVLRGAKLGKLIEHGPSSDEARKVLHDIEPSLQQLGHREAHEVLEILLAEHHPVLGDR